MDIRIGTVTSDIHLADARAMLSPEVLEAIVAAVTERLGAQEQLRRERDRDERIDSSATRWDGARG